MATRAVCPPQLRVQPVGTSDSVQSRPQLEASARSAIGDATVAAIAGKHGKVVCQGDTTLRDAAALLVKADRTAAAVVDSRGAMVGAFTENDVLRAYFGGTEGGCVLDDWLQSDSARLPGFVVQMLTVGPDTGLLEAASRMRTMATSDYASRHVVVQDPGAPVQSILSALDMARALCGSAFPAGAAERLGGGRVAEVMKPRGMLPVCPEAATMAEALESMLGCRQNCVLVTESGDSAALLGVFTTRDALVAFSEGIPLSVLVGHWMFCLGRRVEPRLVEADVPLAVAAAKMSGSSVHHLVVVAPGSVEVVGVMSSSDLAQAMGSAERVIECSL